MARKRSLWSELQRERERRERATRTQERANQQLVRQMVEDAERAERRADRADAAERRRQEQLAHEAGAVAAKEMKAQLDAQVLAPRTLLASVLDFHSPLRGAAVVDENWVPSRRWRGAGRRRLGSLPGSGCCGRRGRCTVVLACRRPSAFSLGPF